MTWLAVARLFGLWGRAACGPPARGGDVPRIAVRARAYHCCRAPVLDRGAVRPGARPPAPARVPRRGVAPAHALLPSRARIPDLHRRGLPLSGPAAASRAITRSCRPACFTRSWRKTERGH
ncbi:hypothetical protein PAHAL_4G214900 [Panicum hallii]|uniref:Uncharacterized protein n=1 Tax=Panicum hallii TaxID=206008 RepID=A0A2T8JDJ7_9POAL|nr:hypothetical protein PAHAL_4G214900 [Panicum hallii]